MWPILFELGPIKIYSFGLMAALAFLAGGYLLKLELERQGLGGGRWSSYATAALIGGIVGARLNYLVTHLEELRLDPRGALFSGSGLVWYGGAVGGFLAVAWIVRRYRHSLPQIADAFAPALAAAYILGRVGCFVSGDGDYGRASDVPWAMAFPNGIVPTTERVHPTPIYEVLLTSGVLWILWRTRARAWRPGSHIGLYLVLSGIERFVIEFWRRNPDSVLGLTTAQLWSIAFVLFGAWLFTRRSLPSTSMRSVARARASRST